MAKIPEPNRVQNRLSVEQFTALGMNVMTVLGLSAFIQNGMCCHVMPF